jgi:hypothetical protein
MFLQVSFDYCLKIFLILASKTLIQIMNEFFDIFHFDATCLKIFDLLKILKESFPIFDNNRFRGGLKGHFEHFLNNL